MTKKKVITSREERKEYAIKVIQKNPALSSRALQDKVKSHFGEGFNRQYLLGIRRETLATLPPPKSAEQIREETTLRNRQKALMESGFLRAEARHIAKLPQNEDINNLIKQIDDKYTAHLNAGKSREEWEVIVRAEYVRQKYTRTKKHRIDVARRIDVILKEAGAYRQMTGALTFFEAKMTKELIDNYGYTKEDAEYWAKWKGLEKSLQENKADFRKIWWSQRAAYRDRYLDRKTRLTKGKHLTPEQNRTLDEIWRRKTQDQGAPTREEIEDSSIKKQRSKKEPRKYKKGKEPGLTTVVGKKS